MIAAAVPLRFKRASLDQPGLVEAIPARDAKRVLSPAELRLLEVRPVTTILSTYTAERLRFRTRGHAVTKKQNQALLVVNAHLLRRVDLNLPQDLDSSGLTWLNEQLVLWLPGWLDELSNTLAGDARVSTTKEAAMRRCVAAIEASTGVTFPQPVRLTSEGLPVEKAKVVTKKPGARGTNPLKPVAAALAAADPKAAAKAGVRVPAKAPAKTPAKKAAAAAIKPNLGRAPAAAPATAKDGAYLIKVLVDANPKREGTASHGRFKLYGGSGGKVTVDAFLKKGGTRGDLRYDVGHGYVKLVKP